MEEKEKYLFLYLNNLLSRLKVRNIMFVYPAKRRGLTTTAYLNKTFKYVPAKGWVYSLIPNIVLTDKVQESRVLDSIEEVIRLYNAKIVEVERELRKQGVSDEVFYHIRRAE